VTPRTLPEVTSTPRERFQIILEGQYARLFETPDYAYVAARTTPAALAAKMTAGLVDGTANKDGEGIKTTCKVLGIKYTYSAIRAFLIAGSK
jgi:hypothetical protein